MRSVSSQVHVCPAEFSTFLSYTVHPPADLTHICSVDTSITSFPSVSSQIRVCLAKFSIILGNNSTPICWILFMICGHKHHLRSVPSQVSLCPAESSTFLSYTVRPTADLNHIWCVDTCITSLRLVHVCLAELSIILAYTQYTYLLI